MSEHEPYDEAMVEHFCTPSPAEYERSEYAYRLALMARSEHTLRLEAEARVEELEKAVRESLDAKDDAMRHPVTESKIRTSLDADNRLRCVLGDSGRAALETGEFSE